MLLLDRPKRTCQQNSDTITGVLPRCLMLGTIVHRFCVMSRPLVVLDLEVSRGRTWLGHAISTRGTGSKGAVPRSAGHPTRNDPRYWDRDGDSRKKQSFGASTHALLGACVRACVHACVRASARPPVRPSVRACVGPARSPLVPCVRRVCWFACESACDDAPACVRGRRVRVRVPTR